MEQIDIEQYFQETIGGKCDHQFEKDRDTFSMTCRKCNKRISAEKNQLDALQRYFLLRKEKELSNVDKELFEETEKKIPSDFGFLTLFNEEPYGKK